MANKRICTVDLISTLYETGRHGWWGFIHRMNKNNDPETQSHRYYNNIRIVNVYRMRALQDAVAFKYGIEEKESE